MHELRCDSALASVMVRWCVSFGGSGEEDDELVRMMVEEDDG